MNKMAEKNQIFWSQYYLYKETELKYNNNKKNKYSPISLVNKRVNFFQ